MPETTSTAKVLSLFKTTDTVHAFLSQLNAIRNELFSTNQSHKVLKFVENEFLAELDVHLKALESLTNQSLSLEIVNPILNLLDNYAKKYFRTVLDPSQDHLFRLNQFCLGIAMMLEDLSGKGRYELLLPTLEHTESVVTTTRLRDPDVQLRHFILSSDGKDFIEIFPCLEYAEQKGKLKHTSLINGRKAYLNEDEAGRLINHSQFTRNYYSAIQAFVNARKNNSELSFGSAIKMLADGLKKGGVDAAIAEQNRQRTREQRKSGFQINRDTGTYGPVGEPVQHKDAAGELANITISAFLEWLSGLKKEEQIALLARSVDKWNQRTTIEHQVKRILRLKPCYALTLSEKPTPNNLHLLNIPIHEAAYVRRNRRLYYVDTNKATGYSIFTLKIPDVDVLNTNANLEKFKSISEKNGNVPLLILHRGLLHMYGFHIYKEENKMVSSWKLTDLCVGEHFAEFASFDNTLLDPKNIPSEFYTHLNAYNGHKNLVIARIRDFAHKRDEFDKIIDINEKRALNVLQVFQLTKLTNHSPLYSNEGDCVNQVSEHLTSILQNNPDLYATYPASSGEQKEGQLSTASCAMLLNNINLARTALKKALEDAVYPVGKPADYESRLLKEVTGRITQSQQLEKFLLSLSESELKIAITSVDPNFLARISFRGFSHTSKKILLSEVAKAENIDALLIKIIYEGANNSTIQVACRDLNDLKRLFERSDLDINRIRNLMECTALLAADFFEKIEQYESFVESIPPEKRSCFTKVMQLHFRAKVIDFPSLIAALRIAQNEEEKISLLEALGNQTVAQLIDVRLKIISALSVLNSFPKTQEKLLTILCPSLPEIFLTADSLTDLSTWINQSNYPRVYTMMQPHWANIIRCAKDFDKVCAIFQNPVANLLYADFADKMPEWIEQEKHLCQLYRWTPSEQKLPFLQSQKHRLPTLLKSGQALALLSEDHGIASLELFDNIQLSKLIKNRADFIACCKNKEFQAALMVQLLPSILSFVSTFEDCRLILEALEPIHKDQFSDLLIERNLFSLFVDDHIKFIKLYSLFVKTEQLQKILAYFQEKNVLSQLIPSGRILINLLKSCMPEQQEWLIKNISLSDLVKKEEEYNEIETILESEQALEYFYIKLGPLKAKFQAARIAALNNNLLSLEETKKLLTVEEEKLKQDIYNGKGMFSKPIQKKVDIHKNAEAFGLS